MLTVFHGVTTPPSPGWPFLQPQRRAQVLQSVHDLIPGTVTGQCRLVEALSRLAQFDSVQTVAQALKQALTTARADGSTFQRDVAAVALFRSLQRVSRYCAEFAKVASACSAPLFQDALTTIHRFESGFVEPVRVAVVFDASGRIARLRSGLSEAYVCV